MEKSFTQKEVMHTAVRMVLLFSLLYLSMKIVQPFILLVIWAGVIATALYPLHEKLTVKFNGNNKRSAVFITFLGLAVLIIPVWASPGLWLFLVAPSTYWSQSYPCSLASAWSQHQTMALQRAL